MKPKHRVLATLLILFLAVGIGTAQNVPQGQRPQGMPGSGGTLPEIPSRISGVVTDEGTGEPIATATVALHNSRDSSLVTGAVADEKGQFSIEGVRPGQFYLRISYIGYSPLVVENVSVSPQKWHFDAGTLNLKEDTQQLAEIQVSGERADVSYQVDRTVYNTRQMQLATGGNASDLLQQIPSVEVDADGRISLRGNQSVAIHINGKPSPLTGDFLTSYIQQLPANAIERIEVIPNPSAKYDPDGMAGILNIVLKQNTEVRGGGIMAGLGVPGKYNASINGNYQKNKLSLFANYGFRSDERKSDGLNSREYFFQTDQPFMSQLSTAGNNMLGHNAGAGLDYSLTKRSTLSFNANLNLFGRNSDGTLDYSSMNAARDVMERSSRLNSSENDGTHASYNLTYRYVVEPSRNELTADLRLSQFDHNQDNVLNNNISLQNGLPANLSEVTNSETSAKNRDWIAQLDYARPMGQKGKIEAGYKGVLRLIDNDFHQFGNRLSGPFDDLNVFEFDEQQHSLYGLVSQGFGKFDLQAGVRLEQATTDFTLHDPEEEHFDNDYFSVFPSAIVSYKPKDGSQWKLSYTKRISRPEPQMLNKYMPTDDPLNRFEGNPYLKPQYTHAFEGGYQTFSMKGNLSVTPFFRRTYDAWSGYQRIDPVTRVNTFSIANLETNDSYGLDVNAGIRRGSRFSANVGFNAFKMVTSGVVDQNNLGVNTVTWNTRIMATWEPRQGTQFQFMTMYRPRTKTEQGYQDRMVFSNVSVRQTLTPQMNLTVRVMDPLDMMKFNNEVRTVDYYALNERHMQNRAVFLSLQYNFGKQVQRKTTRRPDEGQVPSTTIDPAGQMGQ